MKKLVISFTVVGVLVALCAACAGPMGKGEGDGCSGNDECGSNLTCQPVGGHGGDYCCPAPLQLPDGTNASKESNCQPTTH
jgi:hypothetical protein